MPRGSSSDSDSSKDPTRTAAKASNALKASRGARRSGAPGQKREAPWFLIGAAVVLVGLVLLLALNLLPKYQERAALEEWTPTSDNPDPSTAIPDVQIIEYPAAMHVTSTQRVAYDQAPPFGGPHDATWATCTGVVYPEAIRTENAVHSLEHGAIWITYNPDTVPADQVAALAARVEGQQYMLMSPYPNLDPPISLQSWGHRLQVDSADDERIGQFISALRLNSNVYPEVGASCSSFPGSGFDPDNPPLFDPNPPGPDAVTMDGAGSTTDGSELGAPNGGAPAGPMTEPAPAGEPGPATEPAPISEPTP